MGLNDNLRDGPPFQSSTWWIDECGCEHASEPLTPLNEKWFYRHLGQAKLEFSGALVEVAWDCMHVHTEALAKVKSLLSSMGRDVKVRLSFHFKGWSYELYHDAFSAMERIEDVQESLSVGILFNTMIGNCPITDVNYANARIRRGYQSWDQTAGYFQKADQSDLAKILPHSLIYCPDDKAEKLVYSWIGTRSSIVNILGRKWMDLSIGENALSPIGEEPQDFVDAISPGITRTMETGEPLYQHVRTLVDIKGHENFWLPYERLLTRHTMHDGRPAVCCDVYATQYIDVSFVGRS